MGDHLPVIRRHVQKINILNSIFVSFNKICRPFVTRSIMALPLQNHQPKTYETGKD
jgi:hypothetical protein